MSNETSVNSDIDVANDRIRGVRAIAEFCGDTIRHTQYLLETNRLPAGKEGRLWVASKQRLREHHWQTTARDAADG